MGAELHGGSYGPGIAMDNAVCVCVCVCVCVRVCACVWRNLL